MVISLTDFATNMKPWKLLESQWYGIDPDDPDAAAELHATIASHSRNEKELAMLFLKT